MRPTTGAALPFHSPAVDRFSLANGTEVLLLERHALPTVYWQIQFPTGSVTDPPGKEGRAALCTYLLVQGGAADTVTRLADSASDISVNWGLDTVALNGFALTQHLNETLDLWRLTLDFPGMDAGQLAWVRQQLQGQLLQQRADPTAIAWRTLCAWPMARTIRMRACPRPGPTTPSPWTIAGSFSKRCVRQVRACSWRATSRTQLLRRSSPPGSEPPELPRPCPRRRRGHPTARASHSQTPRARRKPRS